MQRLSGYPTWFYRTTVLLLALLFASGVWLLPGMFEMRLALEVPWRPQPAWRLLGAACHSCTGFLALALLGALAMIHMRIGWRLRLNRASGMTLVLLTALLLASAIAILYAGCETLSVGASIVHTAIGVLGTLAFLWHALAARAVRRRVSRARA